MLLLFWLQDLAQIGEFELASKEIISLKEFLRESRSQRMYKNVIEALGQIQKIELGMRQGNYFVRLHARDPQKGILFSFKDAAFSSEESSLIDLKSIELRTQEYCDIYFKDIQSDLEKENVRRMVKKRTGFKFFHPPRKKYKSQLRQKIDDYLERTDLPYRPIIVSFEKIKTRVRLNKFNNKRVNLNLKEMVLLPGINDNGKSALVLKGSVYLIPFRFFKEKL